MLRKSVRVRVAEGTQAVLNVVDSGAVKLCIESLCVCCVCRCNPSLAVTHGAALLIACMCRVVVRGVGVYLHSRTTIKRTGENGLTVLLAPNRTPACLLRPRGQSMRDGRTVHT